MSRLPGLDGIRGLAILLVLVSHLLGFTGAGLVGVLVFFGLSGYLITSLLLREQATTGRIDLRRFYLRRALRLLPALLLLLALVWIAAAVPGTGLSVPDALRGSVHGIFYVTDFVLGLQLNYVPELAHLWTLAVEEQFYLLWPLVLIGVVIRARPERRVDLMARLVGVGVMLRLATILFARPLKLFFYALPTTWVDCILTGCALALLVHERPTWEAMIRRIAKQGWTKAAAWTALLGFAFHPATYLAPVTYVVGIPIMALATCVLVLAVTEESSSLTQRVLNLQVMRWFGDHSYGLYLFNSTCVLVAVSLLGPGLSTRVIAMLVAVALAIASRRFIELPALRLRSRVAPYRHLRSP